jgi:hypothetical protein
MRRNTVNTEVEVVACMNRGGNLEPETWSLEASLLAQRSIRWIWLF